MKRCVNLIVDAGGGDASCNAVPIKRKPLSPRKAE